MNILLVEPGYQNKYPPLGLMKIATFHKNKNDTIVFVKGLNQAVKAQKWDRIYISTLFSFYWKQTIETIKYYEFSVINPQHLFIGGVLATIMGDEIERETGFKTIKGLLNEKGKLRLSADHTIDALVPDYSILDSIDYKYPAHNAYFGYMTRGCVRKCSFCVVPKIEPTFVHYISLKKQVKEIKNEYGDKKDLLLLDNNILASSEFDKIVEEIKEIGFYKGATLNKRRRYVDFNQGVDLRLLTKAKMARLAELPIKPLRIAFDHIKLKDQYIKCIEWAAEFGLRNLSNYILYNFIDLPEDLYERLKINIELNKRLGTKIFSFPMKYVPECQKDRKYIGKNWNARYLRGIQCILSATHGVVGPGKDFFEAAFGEDVNAFKKLLLMPDAYIIYRKKHKNNGAATWEKSYRALTKSQKSKFESIVLENKFHGLEPGKLDLEVDALLKHYYEKRSRLNEGQKMPYTTGKERYIHE